MSWFRRRKDDNTPVGTNRWCVVGLGNPGAQYSGNRHNVGFFVVDEMASSLGLSFRRHNKIPGLIAEGRMASGEQLVLLKPTAFMNRSGGAVVAAMRYFDVPAERVIVVHDELDVPFGVVRLKQGGGHGGHNGLRDTISATSTPDFVRVRVGIGRPPGRQDPADFVLRDFSSAERPEVPFLVADAVDAVESVITDGLVAAQQHVHAPKP